ncbi:uncharacterized protein [Apostichopus japonicus]|uniref:uncharacterized protein n=1 Tax=Stichopus japonicus TaxID=307972 RepID=UPI003AB5C58C
MECSNRSLHDVPTDIPSNVIKIVLSMNNLTSIHWNAFITATQLKAIDLSHNKLVELPEKLVWENEKLQSIDLSMNNLTFIHWNAFITATKLKTINLSHNKLVELPEKLVGNNEKLQSLLLSNNELECLHEDVVYNTPTIKVIYHCFALNED